jgi:4-carboxymuconolactone decarboxylase
MTTAGLHGQNYADGLELGGRLGGETFAPLVAQLRAIDEELADDLVAHAYGRILSRPGLELGDRELVIIAALAAQGSLPQLEWHLAAALRIGVPPEALREVLIQLVPLAGWPCAMNALGCMKRALSERQLAFSDLEQVPRSPADRAKLAEIGRRHGAEVYPDFPSLERAIAEWDAELAAYLTENAYGQIYDRPGLDVRRRELVAVSQLTTLQRLPQLRGHLVGAHRVGCSRSETKEVIITLVLYVGWPATLNALGVWAELGTE